jgi:predicted Zn-dependent protease
MLPILLVAVPLGATFAKSSKEEDFILGAMTEEMARSKENLKLEGYDPPFFISYSVRTTEREYISAKASAIFASNRSVNTTVDVDVRVGSYELDSSEDKDIPFGSWQRFFPGNAGPIEDSVFALRRVLWLLTDYNYKRALVSFMKVKGQKVNDPRERKRGSLTREEPVVLSEVKPPFKFDRKQWEDIARAVSGVLSEYDFIFDGGVEVSAMRLGRYFVNSEGTRVRTVDDYFMVMMNAVTRASDGELLQDEVSYQTRTALQLPLEEELLRQARNLANRLRELRNAKVIDPITCPVLLSAEASGVFFHETVGHRLEGQRQENEEEGRTFTGYLGAKILPDFIDIYDDPTLAAWDSIPLNGHYRVDDEGVPARKVELVVGGVLRGFLMSRKPVEGFDKSNGHGRADGYQMPVGRMGNLVIVGKKPVSSERLRQLLLEEVRRQGKPFGLIIESVSGGSTNTSTYGYQAFKGIPRIAWRVDRDTGALELVRGFEIVGTPLQSISKVIATSDKYGVFNGYCGAESGSIPVSTVAPEVLFEEMEIQRSSEAKERPPILPPPARERKK